MKKPKTPKSVTIAIMTTVTIVAWVFFEVYRAFTKEVPPVVPEGVLAPLDPTLDKTTLETLGQRTFFEEGAVNLPLPSPTPEENSAATPTLTASPSGQIASPSATPTTTPTTP